MTTRTDNPGLDLDRDAFGERVEPHRRELHVHCYRMLGSFEESEDVVQETFLRAWRRRESFEGRSSLRAWLYKIATNACLDALDKRPRKVSPSGEVLWLDPYPDALLEQIPAGDEDPEATAVQKETIELAFLVAIQHLPPLQRAVLILRDVLDLSAKETASILETTVPAINSALQRAHGAMKDHLPQRRTEWPAGADATASERELVDKYIAYSERADPLALKRLLAEDARFWMPPQPGIWRGRDAVFDCWVEGGFGSEAFGAVRVLETRANRQPAIAYYVRTPGDDGFSPLALDVLAIDGGEITEIVVFGPPTFAMFGLPERL